MHVIIKVPYLILCSLLFTQIPDYEGWLEFLKFWIFWVFDNTCAQFKDYGVISEPWVSAFSSFFFHFALRDLR